MLSHIKSLENLKIIRDDLNNFQNCAVENKNDDDDSLSDSSESSESSVDDDNLSPEAPIVLVNNFYSSFNAYKLI